ncbi:MAG: two-component sensor histidine kinase [Bacteroidia bacterium]|nr:two-component sensor histidine kinase [Bacteroidia bacterium]
MKKPGRSIWQYTLFGISFGFCFPLLALTFDVLIHYRLKFNLESILFVHRENPIHYLIDTAPFFLGLAFGVAGYYQYKTRMLNASLLAQASNLKNANDQLTKAIDDYHAAQHQMLKTEKLASLGQLTAGIAHELKNPLNFINNFSESGFELLDELLVTNDPEERKEIIEMIRSNLQKIHQHGNRSNNILKNMMMHARSGKAERRMSDINQVCKDAAEISFHGTSSNILGFSCDFKKEYADEIPKTWIVHEDISRVIINLLTNAFYAVTERKKNEKAGFVPTVTLKTSFVNNTYIKNKGTIFISVRDNGTGIPDHVREQIFHPFFTTKPSGEGTGLGLSISQDIMEAHGGSLSVDSVPLDHTEFTITLPLIVPGS